jgi:hypothetical protein
MELQKKLKTTSEVLEESAVLSYEELGGLSDPGLRDCLHNVVHTGIGDRTCPIPYLYCTLLACKVGSYSSCTRIRFLHVTLSSRIYKGGQGPPQNTTSKPKAIQTTKHDVGYYAHRGPNLSKPCVACTFEFLISASPYLKITTWGIPLGGQAVKHQQRLPRSRVPWWSWIPLTPQWQQSSNESISTGLACRRTCSSFSSWAASAVCSSADTSMSSL